MYTPKRRAHALAAFDVFNKTERSVLVRSRYGGVLTVCALVLMLSLVIYEIAVYRNVELVQSITVDVSRDQTMTLWLDIVFHDMPCSDINLDVVDQLGKQQDVGNALEKVKVQVVAGNTDNCPPCYIGRAERCCSCLEAKQYYSSHGIYENHELSPPCLRDSQFTGGTLPATEGCRVKGVMPLPKIQGNFHVAPGSAMSAGHSGHSHQMNPFTFKEELAKTKLSHTINRISFGPSYPGLIEPLTHYHYATGKLVRQIYYLRLVPTIYMESGSIVHTHQYSVTNHTDVIDLSNLSTLQLPGVFFKYDFSPMLVKMEKKTKYFSHFLTRMCAIIGGTWVVLGLIYSSLQTAVDKLKKTK